MSNALLFLQSPTPSINCDNFAPACITNVSSLSNLLIPLIYIVAAIAFLGILIMGAFLVIQASGDPTKIKEAQQTITYSFLGVIVIILAFFLVRIIASVLGIPFLL